MTQCKPLPPVELLRELFDYDPLSGCLTFRVYNHRHRKGDVLSRRNSAGYLCWTHLYDQYYAHRIAWKIYTGEEPPEVVDHRNRRRDDNRWKNLRASTEIKNRYNMTPWGKRYLPGVFQRREGAPSFQAKISVNKKQIYLGSYPSEVEAHRAYVDAHLLYFGEHSIYAET